MSADQVITLEGKEFELFIESGQIKEAIQKLADEINKEYVGKELVVVGVLDGVFMVLSDLLKKLKVNVSLELVKLKSYQGEHSTGTVRKIIGLTSGLKGQRVLIVEDIIDTGRTLGYLLDLIQEQKPKSLQIASLLLKADVFKDRFKVDYVGFSIPNRFVVGYGMDYNGQGRQMKHIYAATEPKENG